MNFIAARLLMYITAAETYWWTLWQPRVHSDISSKQTQQLTLKAHLPACLILKCNYTLVYCYKLLYDSLNS